MHLLVTVVDGETQETHRVDLGAVYQELTCWTVWLMVLGALSRSGLVPKL